MKQLLASILLFCSLSLFAQNCDPKDFEQLNLACNKKYITPLEFSSYLKIARRLEENKCTDYVQKRNGQEYVKTGLTYLLGRICVIANTDSADREYIGYLLRNSNSAEEQRSFSFEYIFKQNPQRVLSLIKFDTELLDHIVWGFVNNRYYGVDDPHENDPNKAYTVYDKELKRVLTVKSYEDIFYKVYPSLKNDTLHQKQIEYLLSTIEKELKE